MEYQTFALATGNAEDGYEIVVSHEMTRIPLPTWETWHPSSAGHRLIEHGWMIIRDEPSRVTGWEEIAGVGYWAPVRQIEAEQPQPDGEQPASTSPTPDDLGRIAYEAYVVAAQGRSVHGEPIPPWQFQRAYVQRAWTAAAAAAAAATAASEMRAAGGIWLSQPTVDALRELLATCDDGAVAAGLRETLDMPKPS